MNMKETTFYSFIQQILTVNLLCTRTVLNASNILVNKKGQNICPHGAYISATRVEEGEMNKQINT